MPLSWLGLSFIVLAALIGGLFGANMMVRDRAGRALVLAIGAFVAVVTGSVAWVVVLLLELGRRDAPAALAVVGISAAVVYAMIAWSVGWGHYRQHHGQAFSAFVIGLFWLPLTILLRRR